MMTESPTVRLDFRREVSPGRLCLMFIPAALVGLGGCGLLIGKTFGTDYESTGFLLACGAILAVAGVFVWWLYSAMTPMTLEARPDGLVVSNRKAGTERRLDWGEVGIHFVAGAEHEVMFLQFPDERLAIKQHPKYLPSPPTYDTFRAAAVHRVEAARKPPSAN